MNVATIESTKWHKNDGKMNDSNFLPSQQQQLYAENLEYLATNLYTGKLIYCAHKLFTLISKQMHVFYILYSIFYILILWTVYWFDGRLNIFCIVPDFRVFYRRNVQIVYSYLSSRFRFFFSISIHCSLHVTLSMGAFVEPFIVPFVGIFLFH